ncbi:unnamed protein product [Spodoptera exigua]|nr:unnamed protein product [Spodoptera exigua]
MPALLNSPSCGIRNNNLWITQSCIQQESIPRHVAMQSVALQPCKEWLALGRYDKMKIDLVQRLSRNRVVFSQSEFDTPSCLILGERSHMMVYSSQQKGLDRNCNLAIYTSATIYISQWAPSVMIAYIVTERPMVVYYNKKFISNVTVISRRRSRDDPVYYINFYTDILVPLGNNVSSQEAPDVDSACQIWVDQELQNTNMDEVNPDPLIPQTDDEYDSAKLDEQPSKVKIERRSSPIYYKKIKKKKLKHRATPRNYSTDSVPQCTKEDEFDIYGKYIASQLRKMDLHKALRIQLEIQNLQQDSLDDANQKIWLSTTDNMEEETLEPFPEDDEYTLILKTEPREVPQISESRYQNKKKKIKHRRPSTDCSERTFVETIDSNIDTAKEDEFDIYGKYIASQLRKMDLQKALRVQLEIQSLVSEARLSGLNGKH